MQVFDGWVMKGEKFPSSQDHPLPPYERYTDYCDSGSVRRSVRSSQNVAMVFFHIHEAGSSFTLTVRKHINPFREYDTQRHEHTRSGSISALGPFVRRIMCDV